MPLTHGLSRRADSTDQLSEHGGKPLTVPAGRLCAMLVDQAEIEALLVQAENAAEEAGGDSPAPATPAPKPPLLVDASADVNRILKIRVPVIAQLASRRMSIHDIRKLSVGMIIEFLKGVERPLDLLINNHPVGRGEAMKVGERFGLRITEIRDAATRIKSMGK